MDEIAILTSLALFLLLAAGCSIVFNKIKLPPLIGYLMAGIIVANFWQTTETGEIIVEILSDMGLIMLMFCIGLEINLKKIRKQGLFAIEVAAVQLPLMILGGILGGSLLGFDSLQCLCLGAIISGSSTAAVTAVLKTQNQLDRDHIETIILVLIMEDIGQVIILSIITPLMAGSELDAGGLTAMVVCILAFMIASIFFGLRMMPRIINWISDNVSSEVLVITAVGLAFGMALLANIVGLSVAIGSFLMGMMVASSRKSRDVMHDIEPMKNIFMAMFFISVGMEISLNTIVDNIGTILIFYGMFAFLIISSVSLGYWLGNETCRIGFVSSVSLAVMGEFAFIIAKQALDYNVVDDAFYTSVIGAALLSMIILPILSKSSGRIWDTVVRKMPDPLLGLFNGINNVKTSFYEQISYSSKRTRREINQRMTHAYALILIIIVIQTFFVLISQVFVEWAVTYFGGFVEMWGTIILMLNLVAIYLPLYKLVSNVKFINQMVTENAERMVAFGSGNNLMENALRTNNSILALIIDIIILILVPNGINFWLHILVLLIALCVLLFLNRKALRNKADEEPVPTEEDAFFDSIDTEKFKALIRRKMQKDDGTDDTDRSVVSIDTGDSKT